MLHRSSATRHLFNGTSHHVVETQRVECRLIAQASHGRSHVGRRIEIIEHLNKIAARHGRQEVRVYTLTNEHVQVHSLVLFDANLQPDHFRRAHAAAQRRQHMIARMLKTRKLGQLERLPRYLPLLIKTRIQLANPALDQHGHSRQKLSYDRFRLGAPTTALFGLGGDVTQRARHELVAQLKIFERQRLGEHGQVGRLVHRLVRLGQNLFRIGKCVARDQKNRFGRCVRYVVVLLLLLLLFIHVAIRLFVVLVLVNVHGFGS